MAVRKEPRQGPSAAEGSARPTARTVFLSPRDLALRWSCSRTTAQRVAARARFAKYFLGEGRNGMVRYLLSEVEAYEEKRRVASLP
jgi:hypothetical protein